MPFKTHPESRTPHISYKLSFPSLPQETLGKRRWLGVTDSGEGVCVDPGEREAILGTGEPGPPEKGKGQQLAPDSGGEGT
jgi:hypothetical protein